MASKHEFPYGSFDACIQDNGRKLGVGAAWKQYLFQLLRTGYYQVQTRKERNMAIAEDRSRFRAIQERVARDPKLAEALKELIG